MKRWRERFRRRFVSASRAQDVNISALEPDPLTLLEFLDSIPNSSYLPADARQNAGAGKSKTNGGLPIEGARAKHLVNVDPKNETWWIDLAYSVRRIEEVEKAEAILLRRRAIHPAKGRTEHRGVVFAISSRNLCSAGRAGQTADRRHRRRCDSHGAILVHISSQNA